MAGTLILGYQRRRLRIVQPDAPAASLRFRSSSATPAAATSCSRAEPIPRATILFLGILAGGNGTYCLCGSGQLSGPLYEYIGWPVVSGNYSGTGSFTQTGRNELGSGSLNLASGSGYSGTYCLNGGLLSLTALNAGQRQCRVRFRRRDLPGRAGPSTTYVPIVLSTAGSNGVFDTKRQHTDPGRQLIRFRGPAGNWRGPC